MNEPEENWQFNYFNYFTEVEEHFQRARGTGLFFLSPLDWALIELWKDSGVPLEAVLGGIDAAFEKWRSRKSKVRMVNSLAYCSQAVLEKAQLMAGMTPARPVAIYARPRQCQKVPWQCRDHSHCQKNPRLQRHAPVADPGHGPR